MKKSAATKGARTRAEHRALWLADIVSYVSEFVELPKPNLPDFELPDDPLSFTNLEIDEIAAHGFPRHVQVGHDPVGGNALHLR